jgi:hypothetical protein
MKVNLTCLYQCFLMCGLLFFSISCDNTNNIESPSSKYFVKYYGEDGDQQAVDMVLNSDGTFLLLGNSTGGTQTIFLIKADAEGHVLWQRKFGTSTDVPKDIEPTLDGNFVLLSDYQEGVNNIDIKLIRITADGNKIDSVTMGTEDAGNFYSDHSKSVTPISDGGFIVTGYADYDYTPSDDADRQTSIFHFRFGSDLTPFDDSTWENYYGTGTTNIGTKVIQKNGSFYVFGYTDSKSTQDNPNDKMLLLYYSLSETGASENPAYLGDVNEDTEANFVLDVPASLIDGYFLVSTSNRNTLSAKLRVSALRNPLQFIVNDDKQFDSNVFGSKRLEGVYAAPSMFNSKGFLVVANETKETGETDIMLSKIDQSGGEVWSVNFGSENNDRAAAVAELPDGRIIVLCTIETIVQTKMALLKLNSKGQLLN